MKALGIVALAVALTLSGCAPATAQLDSEGNTLLVAPPQKETVERLALISGTIAIGPGGCYGLENEHGFFLAVFPAGTTLDRSGVVTVAEHMFEVGDAWKGGGGYVRPSESPADIPEGCAPSGDLITLGQPE